MRSFQFVILAIWLGMCPGVAIAQVTMEARLGLQGTVRLEKWNLVTVNLRNAGAPLAGTLGVRIWRGSEFRKDLHVTTFTQPVALPHRSRKRFTFAVPITSIAHPVEVFLRQNDHILVQRRLNLRDAFSAEHIILGLTRDLSLDFLATTFQRHTRVVYLPPGELPQHWSGYDSVSAIVVKGVSLQSMTERQTVALQQWIARGGTLVVAGDSQYALLQEPRLRALLPVRVLGIQRRNGLPAFAERYGVPLPATPLLAIWAQQVSGQVVVGTAEAPLLAQRTFGKGRVVFLAIDYAMQPLASWQGNKALWKDILRPVETIDVGRVFADLGLLDDAHPILKLLRRPILAYPSHVALSLFLLAYCGGLGLLFWRMGKPWARCQRCWVGVLLLIGGSTVGAYTVFPERGLRRPAMVIDSTVMEVLPETGYAHAHGYLGVFSARGGEFSLAFQHPETILRHTFHRGIEQAGQSVEITATEKFAMHGIAVAPWTLRILSVESMLRSPVRVAAWKHPAGLTIQVKNQGTLPLQGTAVVYRGKLFALGSMAPGEEIFEDLYTTLQPTESKQETIWQALFKLRPAVDDTRLAYLQEVLLQHHFGEDRLSETDDTPFLAGWLVAPSTLQQTSATQPVQGMTFVISRLPL